MKRAILECMKGNVSIEDDGRIHATFCFPETFKGFQGHFPGNPILPAVVQIQIAQVCIACFRGVDVGLSAVVNAKFIDTVGVGDELVIECVDKGDGRFGCNLNNISAAKPASRFQLILQ